MIYVGNSWRYVNHFALANYNGLTSGHCNTVMEAPCLDNVCCWAVGKYNSPRPSQLFPLIKQCWLLLGVTVGLVMRSVWRIKDQSGSRWLQEG